MTTRKIAICDQNEFYALSLSEIIRESVNKSFEIFTFTAKPNFSEFSNQNTVDILIITESTFTQGETLDFEGELIILQENNHFFHEGAVLIDRFQSREVIKQEIIKSIPEYTDTSPGKRCVTSHWKVIGLYSPIHGCMQTTFALTLGQLLAEEHKVLYLNFENFSGFSSLFQREFETDIIDLLYFFDCAPEKIKSKIPHIVQPLGQLDFVPPARGYFDILDHDGEKWIRLLETIENSTEYEYLILEITDAMNGVLQLLGYCDRVYTLVRDDPLSQMKLSQYEKWMVDHLYADVIEKTRRFALPAISNLSIDPERLSKSELAECVKAIIQKENEEHKYE